MFGASKTASASTGGPADPYFYDVTMLLTGDGTNGAQNNTFLDSSSNAFSITRNGNTTQGSFSPYGSLWSVYSTNGASSYLKLPSVTLSGDFTIECWVYGTSGNAATYPWIAFTLGDPSASTGFECYALGNSYSNAFTFYTNNSRTGTTFTGLAYSDVWNHVAIVRSGSTISCYINGARAGTQSNSSTFSGTISLGSNQPTFANASSQYISNFRLVTGYALYSGATYTVPTTPLTSVTGTTYIACASNRFNETANNSTVTVTGTPSVQRFSPFNPTTAYSTATIGGSGYFVEASSASIQTTSSATIGSGSFTIEGWFYRPSTSRFVIASVGDENTSTGITFYIDGSTGYYNFVSNGSVTIVASAPPANTINCWQHIAFVRSGSTVTCYINGVSYGTASTSSSFSGLVTLGAEIYAGTTYAGTTGYVSNVRLTNTAVYSSTFTPPSSPVTAISGTQFLCNFTNAGIPDNAMMNDLETVGNAQVSTSVKKYGTGSLYFDGVSGTYLAAPYSPWMDFGSGNFTIEFWAYFNSVSSGRTVFCGNNASVLNYSLYIATSGTLSYYLSSDGYTYNIAAGVSMGSISTGAWMHIALVRNGNTFTPYINGVAGTTTTSSSAIYNPQMSTYIGGLPAGYNTNAYIDDVRITKGVARYVANFTPPTAALPTY